MTLCSVNFCNSPKVVKGMCQKHYDQIRRNGKITKYRKNKRIESKCIIFGCDEISKFKNLCKEHYYQYRCKIKLQNNIKCIVNGCNRIQSRKSYCATHYSQIRKYGEIREELISDRNQIIIKSNYAELILKKLIKNKMLVVGVALIDISDVDIIKEHKWYLTENKYISTSINNKKIYLHRFLLNLKNGDRNICDHINRNKLDNRRENLRLVDRSINSFNKKQKINTISGVTGVTLTSNNKWVARIHKNNKLYRLGTFIDKDEAIRIRKKTELDLYGEYSPN